jgi:hypothetical protein
MLLALEPPVAVPVVPLVEPAVLPAPAVELPAPPPDPVRAFIRTKRSLALEPLDDPALVPLVAVPVEPLPDVPVEPPVIESARWRHPVTVMLCELLLDCDDCAPALPVNASASTATPPIHVLRFI